MELTYDLTQKDFYNSFLAHRERSVGLKWCFRLLFGSIFLFPAIKLLTLAIDHDTNIVSVIPLFALAAFWAFFIWGTPWWSARTECLQQPAAQGSRTMTLDGSGIHWRWKGGQADVDKCAIAFGRSARTGLGMKEGSPDQFVDSDWRG